MSARRLLFMIGPLVLAIAGSAQAQRLKPAADAGRCSDGSGTDSAVKDAKSSHGERRPLRKRAAKAVRLKLLTPKCPSPAQRWAPGLH